MKIRQAVVITFFLLVSLYAFADKDQEYRELIQNYDAVDEAKAVQQGNPYDFWYEELACNERLYSFRENIGKKRGAEKEALANFGKLPKAYPQFDELVFDSAQSFCDSLLIRLGVAEVEKNFGIKCTLHIISSPISLSYVMPSEDGFAIYLTTALVNHKGSNYEVIMGHVVREFVHVYMQHHLSRLYADAKGRRKERLLTGLAIGATAALNATNAYLSAKNGTPYYYNNVIVDASTSVEVNNESPEARYIFSYLSEQIFEADMIAYRFMEKAGCGEAYLNGLRILASERDGIYDSLNPDAPLSERINLLKYAQSHPEYGNSKNIKRRRHREALLYNRR